MAQSSSSQTLPKTMRALVQQAKGEPLKVQIVPTPTATHGSVVVQTLAVSIDQHLPRILSGAQGFEYPLPFVPGARSIGRIAVTGPDTTSLPVGQLVMVEPWMTSRDNAEVQVLWGAWDGATPASKKWMADNWAFAALSEYVRAPLENCWPLNEDRLCKELGYSIPELIQLTIVAVGYAGLRGINLQAGERVIVSPATGMFSGATVAAAVAMGANVVAVGRKLEVLKKLQATFPDQVKIVQLTGDVEQDTIAMKQFGPVDAVLDMSPAPAQDSDHTKAAIKAVRQSGRVSIMGIFPKSALEDLTWMVFRNLTIRGQAMYERDIIPGMIKVVESGLLRIGKGGGSEVVGSFKFDDIKKAFECANQSRDVGQIVVVTP